MDAAVLEVCMNDLFREYHLTKDINIRNKIASSYMYIAEILSKKFINRGIEYEDIYQVACMGVLYAIERFDPDKGIQFATYATPTVMGEIRRYFRDKGSFVKIPRKLYEIFYKAERIKRSSANRDTTIEEVARILNLPIETIREAYEIGDSSFIQSLEQEAFADGNMSLSNVIGKEDNHFMMIENKEFMHYCLEQLSKKEREFLTLRYDKEMSQKEISDVWEVSQMYVSRFEKRLLKKLRNMYFHE